jgi:hypothetical protein
MNRVQGRESSGAGVERSQAPSGGFTGQAVTASNPRRVGQGRRGRNALRRGVGRESLMGMQGEPPAARAACNTKVRLLVILAKYSGGSGGTHKWQFLLVDSPHVTIVAGRFQ